MQHFFFYLRFLYVTMFSTTIFFSELIFEKRENKSRKVNFDQNGSLLKKPWLKSLAYRSFFICIHLITIFFSYFTQQSLWHRPRQHSSAARGDNECVVRTDILQLLCRKVPVQFEIKATTSSQLKIFISVCIYDGMVLFSTSYFSF